MNNKNYSCFSKAFLLVALLCCVSTEAFAFDFSAKNSDEVTIYYNRITNNGVVEAEVTCMDVDDYSGVVNIPATVTDEENEKELSVTSIGVGAFGFCSGLTAVTIPNSVTSIGDNAFGDCSSLASVTIGSSVGSIGYGAFDGCSNLAEVILQGDALPKCGYNAFDGISSSATLYCPLSLVAACKKDATVSGWNMFNSFASTVTLASGEHLSNYITDTDIQNSITKLTVSGEINSTDITLLKDMAKNGALSVIDLSGATAKEEGLIGANAFNGCTKLTSISLPKNVTSIGDNAFYYCSSLTSIVIPNSVTSIGNGAFYYCSSLTSVTIPNSVTSIGNGAFCCCSSLTSITIPNSVTDIGYRAFDGCTNLTSITIPNSVTNIGEWTFDGCSSLTSVTIGKSVTNIKTQAFANCSKLEEVTLRGKSLPTCYSSNFNGISSDAKLYCRKVLLEAWEDNGTWSNKFLEKNRIAKDFSITIPECGYATGCFYDDLDFTNETEVAAYIVSAFSPKENTVLLTRAKKIPAETGFVVYGTPATYTIPATITDYVYSNMLVSVVDKTTISQTDGEYTNYVLRKKEDSNDVAFILVPANETVTISDYKAYLQVPTSAVSTSSGASGSDAKTSLSLSFDDDEDGGTTGISEIKEQSNRPSGTTVIYNLNGQRKQSLTKGLNIVNGKKIFIK